MVGVKNLDETIKCHRKTIEHVRKRTQKDILSNKSAILSVSQEYQNRLSDHEKCFRSSLVKVALFMSCSVGLGKPICISYDRLKDEEKRLERKLTDSEIHQIVINAAKEYEIIPQDYRD